jgi:hypothetical protein
VVVTLALAGCGAATTGEVSGTVTFEGTPVEDGWIDFLPIDGNGPTTGAKVMNGKFTVANVPVGKAKVVVSAKKIIGQVPLYPTPDSPKRPQIAQMLPPRFSDQQQTELRYDVSAGKNEKNFDLTAK